MNKRYKIIVEAYHWKDVLHIQDFLLGKDNKTIYVGYVSYSEEFKMPVLFLNFKILRTYKPEEVIALLFHEFGHIKQRTYLWRNSCAKRVKSEYLAETYALRKLKKYLNRYLDKYIDIWTKSIYDKDWKKENPIHYAAFSQIKEYKRRK